MTAGSNEIVFGLLDDSALQSWWDYGHSAGVMSINALATLEESGKLPDFSSATGEFGKSACKNLERNVGRRPTTTFLNFARNLAETTD